MLGMLFVVVMILTDISFRSKSEFYNKNEITQKCKKKHLPEAITWVGGLITCLVFMDMLIHVYRSLFFVFCFPRRV